MRTLLLLCQLICLADAQSPGFLIISAPRSALISWVRLPEGSSFNGSTPKTLIDSGLQHPQGIAMDQKRQRLYVADPDVRKIYMYQLSTRDGELRVAGRRTTVCREAESRWVAVDSVGNIFFSDEPRSRILKISAERAMRGGESSPETIIDGTVFAQVNSPGGVAVDNFNVFWTNKRAGAQVGSIIKGPETQVAGATSLVRKRKSVSVLARKAIKSYGVCLALDNVYFTDSEKFLFAVKKNGGDVKEVSSQLQNPRGCAWDGDGTVYVADRGSNAVYSFAGSMGQLKQAHLNKAFDHEDAFGLAVAMERSSSPRGHVSALLWLALLTAGLSLA